jgi:hypothetical protein
VSRGERERERESERERSERQREREREREREERERERESTDWTPAHSRVGGDKAGAIEGSRLLFICVFS